MGALNAALPVGTQRTIYLCDDLPGKQRLLHSQCSGGRWRVAGHPWRPVDVTATVRAADLASLQLQSLSLTRHGSRYHQECGTALQQ